MSKRERERKGTSLTTPRTLQGDFRYRQQIESALVSRSRSLFLEACVSCRNHAIAKAPTISLPLTVIELPEIFFASARSCRRPSTSPRCLAGQSERCRGEVSIEAFRSRSRPCIGHRQCSLALRGRRAPSARPEGSRAVLTSSSFPEDSSRGCSLALQVSLRRPSLAWVAASRSISPLPQSEARASTPKISLSTPTVEVSTRPRTKLKSRAKSETAPRGGTDAGVTFSTRGFSNAKDSTEDVSLFLALSRGRVDATWSRQGRRRPRPRTRSRLRPRWRP